MPSSRSSVERLFSPRKSSDADVLLSEAPEPPESPSQRASSPELTTLPSLTRSPVPPKQASYVELQSLSPQSKDLYATDLSERVIPLDELLLDSEMQVIIGEHKSGSQLLFFVKISEDVAFTFAADRFKADHPELVEEYGL
ncbi:hypothetical protein EIP86_010556 [Pleurotus ostreatoroseus]|nr:hypothetical protein EIP86_010556 [Pleurotus ostreatoroseus]